MTDKVKLTLRGVAKERKPIRQESGVQNAEMVEGVTTVEKEVNYKVTISDPEEFHRLMCKRSASKIAQRCLPDRFTIVTKIHDDWDISTDFNAVEATDWAEKVADNSEDLYVCDILTLWLQTLGGMRIRRALHTKLREEGVDISTVD